eukprot:1194710-Prorocentrum_minimum.AAC.2
MMRAHLLARARYALCAATSSSIQFLAMTIAGSSAYTFPRKALSSVTKGRPSRFSGAEIRITSTALNTRTPRPTLAKKKERFSRRQEPIRRRKRRHILTMDQ